MDAFSPTHYRDRSGQHYFQSICKIATAAVFPLGDGLDKSPQEIEIFWDNVDDAVFDPAEELIRRDVVSVTFLVLGHGLERVLVEKSQLLSQLST